MRRPIVVIRDSTDVPARPSWRDRLRTLAGWALLTASVGLALCAPVDAEANEPAPWIEATIQERADARGVGTWLLTAVLRCESRFDPNALGDHGRSHGIAQINDNPRTGLLGHFHSLGYGSAYSVWESVDYLARVLSGEFVDAGVRPSRWSCYRLIVWGWL